MRITRRGLTPLILLAVLGFASPAGAVDPVELSKLQHAPPPTATATEFKPDPASVLRYGPAYRYPQSGWTVLHIEGAPYERGVQHGRLMAAEIVGFIKARAIARNSKSPVEAWREARTLVNALFLRRYDAEYLQEMKGIADGAAAAGGKYDDRPVDLIDIATINSDLELAYLRPGLTATAAGAGLEEGKFPQPVSTERPHPAEDHCSAFAATGPATADGQIVFGHITMCGLADAHEYNVWIDLKPTAGRRIVMQSYPGGIMSGLDYYMNDAGMLVLETTIEQTHFDATGLTVASRIRRAVQYAESIDKAVEILTESNNGLYTNEWLLADIKTGEIAMLELGTHKQKLWRSSRDEWHAGTKGFYWGCNNGRDLDVRKESLPSLAGKPGNLVFRSTDRDRAWLKLFDKHRGGLAEDFGFEAFTTPTLAAFPSCDAKFTTTKLAKEMKSWALFGPPMGRAWTPTREEQEHSPELRPLVSNDWALLSIDAAGAAPKEAVKLADAVPFPEEKEDRFAKPVSLSAAWRGTLLPASDADTWLAAGNAGYERIVALEKGLHAEAKDKPLDRGSQDHLDVALFNRRSQWLSAAARLGHDIPLVDTKSDPAGTDWYHVAAGKGVMLLAALRGELGFETFDRLMDDFGRAHAGQAVTTADFRKAAQQAAGRSLDSFFDKWLSGSDEALAARDGFWSIDSFEEEPESAIIVYGTLGDRTGQREAAEQLQSKIARRWSNVAIPICSDQELDDAAIAGHHLLLIGRPATNALTARMAKSLPVTFGAGSFEVRGENYADAASAVIAAGPNPKNSRYSVVVYAGLGAKATCHAIDSLPDDDPYPAQVMLLPARERARRLCVTPNLKSPAPVAVAPTP